MYVGCRMNKNGIVSKKTNKRDAGSFLLFVFLLPYVCACFWGHVGEDVDSLKKAETDSEYIVEAAVEWGVWELPPEEYLAYRLCIVLPDDSEPEARKAQAVLLRTELAALFAGQGDKRARVEGKGVEKFFENSSGWEEALQESRNAVEATRGEILTYRGEPIRASYFRVSSGSTRDAGEEDCPYLTAVACEQDKAAPGYSSVVRVKRESYIEKLQELLGDEIDGQTIWEKGDFAFDGAGYMTSVSYLDKNGEEVRMDGETFRHLFGLSSASFSLDREEELAVFHVKGVGHGFGMSQYAAQCRAGDGESYEEILAVFFPQTELTKFE